MVKNVRPVVLRCLLLLLFGNALLSIGCGASDPGGGDGGTSPDTPCACTVGAKRCSGTGIQVCERTDPACPTWGPATACPGSACAGDSCMSACQDTCAGGTTRCTTDENVDVCRIGPSGCLEWTQQACPGAAPYCGGDTCKAAIACDPACPSGFTCTPAGVCAGGSPSNLTFDVKTVTVSGKVTYNGAAPALGTSCLGNSGAASSRLLFTEPTKGYTVYLETKCGDSGFTFTGPVYPGTYTVRVNNVNGAGYSNLPQTGFIERSYIANPALVVTADTTGVVLDVRTVTVGGKVTLNGAAPTLGPACMANNGSPSSRIFFTDTAKNYTFALDTKCGDAGFAFTGAIYPGTYAVRVNNPLGTSNIPLGRTDLQSYLANAALVVGADTNGLVLDVKSTTVSGKVTYNGAAPVLGSSCMANNGGVSARVVFTDTAKNYVFYADAKCGDGTFSFTGTVYPGTYVVRVHNPSGQSDLPLVSDTQGYIANPALVVGAPLSGLVFDVKTVSLSGKVTLNGAAPTLGPSCTANNGSVSARLQLIDTKNNYTFYLEPRCGDAGFSFTRPVYPGTYAVRVNNPNGIFFSDLPVASSNEQSYLANPALAATENATGLVFDVKTVTAAGKVTLDGAAPALGTDCLGNTGAPSSRLLFTDTAKNYAFLLTSKCGDSVFTFTGAVYPGTYAVRVHNGNGARYSTVPSADTDAQGYVADPALVLSADRSGLVLDVKTVTAAGKVTLNGATPALGTSCMAANGTASARLLFSEPTKNYAFRLDTKCGDGTFAFTGPIYPGTYAVRVSNVNGATYSNLPQALDLSLGSKVVSRLRLP